MATKYNPSDASHHDRPSFGHPDQPSEGRDASAGVPRGIVDPGPQNRALTDQFPDQTDPPATDVSTQPFFWSSFNISPRRQQQGGWARELTQADFAISEDIAGVNMRLAAGAIRELHWHQTAEWAIVTYGTCRITTIDAEGRPSVEDLDKGDLWYFPAGLPHSLQGLGPDGAEFVLAFDDGAQSESNTLLLTDFLAHLPPSVLAKNFGIDEAAFKDIPLQNLWIFQGEEPGDLQAEKAEVGQNSDSESVVFRLAASKPTLENSGGRVQVADSRNFTISKTIAASLVTIEPGSMRELHWHPNADEWQYWISGQGRMTVFNTGPKATTNDFKAGDVGLVRKSLGHYIENTGTDVLQFVAVFRSDRYEEVSLANWLGHVPVSLLSQHLNISTETLAQMVRHKQGLTPVVRKANGAE